MELLHEYLIENFTLLSDPSLMLYVFVASQFFFLSYLYPYGNREHHQTYLLTCVVQFGPCRPLVSTHPLPCCRSLIGNCYLFNRIFMYPRGDWGGCPPLMCLGNVSRFYTPGLLRIQRVQFEQPHSCCSQTQCRYIKQQA